MKELLTLTDGIKDLTHAVLSYWASTTTVLPLIVGKMILTATCRQWQANTTKKA